MATEALGLTCLVSKQMSGEGTARRNEAETARVLKRKQDRIVLGKPLPCLGLYNGDLYNT